MPNQVSELTDAQIEIFKQLRREQFSRLDESNHVYLDHTGSALYPSCLPKQHLSALQSSVLGNPHSAGSPSICSTSHLTAARTRILQFFKADSTEYDVVFTPNASGGAKIVGECFPFVRGSTLLLMSDNHNSVIGMREYARAKHALVKYISLERDSMRAKDAIEHINNDIKPWKKQPSLLAFPAQSNFSGVKHPLSLCRHAKKRGWYVFLDAAAYSPASPVNLSKIGGVDFMIVSFYKMFGYPTGIGALVVRKRALTLLRNNKCWFAGGTVRYVSNSTNTHVLHHDVQAFEEGTVNFLTMRAVVNGLEFLDSIGMENINAHVRHLTRKLLAGLTDMQWSNGKSKCRVYGPRGNSRRGGTIAFDLILPNGQRADARKLEIEASREGISMRTGCFCNPGAGEAALQLRDFMKNNKCLAKLGEYADMESISKCAGVNFLGCARVSVGLSSNEKDVETFLKFIEEYGTNLLGNQSDISNSVDKCTQGRSANARYVGLSGSVIVEEACAANELNGTETDRNPSTDREEPQGKDGIVVKTRRGWSKFVTERQFSILSNSRKRQQLQAPAGLRRSSV